MSRYFPYIVSHIQLDQPLPANPFPSTGDSGYYAVFWWKQIPLAHKYVERGDRVEGARFVRMVADAIEPVIENYIKVSGRNIKGYKTALLEGSFQDFSDRMNYIFHHYFPAVYPKKTAVSLIICTRNRSEYLDRCLFSIQNLVVPPQEIIVIDNAPVDESSQQVTEKYPNVNYYIEPRAGLDIARCGAP